MILWIISKNTKWVTKELFRAVRQFKLTQIQSNKSPTLNQYFSTLLRKSWKTSRCFWKMAPFTNNFWTTWSKNYCKKFSIASWSKSKKNFMVLFRSTSINLPPTGGKISYWQWYLLLYGFLFCPFTLIGSHCHGLVCNSTYALSN